jgi:hypothetical protein
MSSLCVAGPDFMTVAVMLDAESPGREVTFHQPKPAATVALSSQYWVCSSVQPGTAKRAGAVIRWAGRMVTRLCERKWTRGGLGRCTGAALAEAHKVINRPMTKTDRIVLLSYRGCRADYVRTGGHGPNL